MPQQLRSMITSLENPTIEAWKLRLDCSPREAKSFLASFMDSPDATTFQTNPSGAPAFCIYDSSAPLEGLATFSHDGSEKIKHFYENTSDPFQDGDILVFQARPNLPYSGGSTTLGRLRTALHRAAVAECPCHWPGYKHRDSLRRQDFLVLGRYRR